MIFSSQFFSHHLQRNLDQLKQHISEPAFKQGYLIFAGSMCAGVTLLTSVSVWHALAFAHIAVVIDQVAAPFFAAFLEQWRNVSLVPLAGQFGHLIFSAYLSNHLCTYFFPALRYAQMVHITLIFLASHFAAKSFVAPSTAP